MKNSLLFNARMGAALGLVILGCKKSEAPAGEADTTAAPTIGKTAEGAVIAIDGSSTVFPISEAVAEEFGIMLSLCKYRIAAALAEHATLVNAGASEIVKHGVETPGLDLKVREAAEWTLVFNRLKQLQAQMSDGDSPVLVGSEISI